MPTLLELLLVIPFAAVCAVVVIYLMDWLIETLPARVLPWSVLALVALAMIVFGAAAVVRVGRLP